jgi:hypothetical protein
LSHASGCRSLARRGNISQESLLAPRFICRDNKIDRVSVPSIRGRGRAAIEFDLDKDRFNRAKRGLSLSEANRFDWDSALVIEDRSERYGEQPFQALGFIGLSLCMAVFTQ